MRVKSGTKIMKLICDGDDVRVSTLYQFATTISCVSIVITTVWGSCILCGKRTISCQPKDNNSQNTLNGAQSKHQRETHFDFVCAVERVYVWCGVVVGV